MAAKTPQLLWTEPAGHESLATCLRAVLAHLDMERPLAELTATLGLGAAVVAAPNDELAFWDTYARDARLVETAGLYGLRLRPLHPRDAAVGLDSSEEYAQHFLDSYVPLVAAALEHGQLVFAWQGWPAPGERLWGVITHRQASQLCGHAPGHGGQLISLIGPALQVYVAEEQRRTDEVLAAARLFAHVARQACEMWAGAWAADAALYTGATAYEAWKDALRSRRKSRTGALPVHQQHCLAARGVATARSHLAHWLRDVAESLTGNQQALAERWAATCDRVAGQLRLFDSARSVRTLFDEPDGVERICNVMDDVSRTEAETISALEDVS